PPRPRRHRPRRPTRQPQRHPLLGVLCRRRNDPRRRPHPRPGPRRAPARRPTRRPHRNRGPQHHQLRAAQNGGRPVTQPDPGRPTAEDIVAAAGITPPPTIDVAAPQGINNLIQALDNGILPDTYVRNGTLVQLVHVTATTNNSNQRAPLAVVDVTPDSLQRLLARHTRTIRYRATRHGTEEVPTMPAGPVVKAVLTETRWPGLRPLRGIVTAPVIRPDGTILQTEGYDPATWLYYEIGRAPCREERASTGL